MEDKIILLVEDDPDDEALTLRALKENNILTATSANRWTLPNSLKRYGNWGCIGCS